MTVILRYIVNSKGILYIDRCKWSPECLLPTISAKFGTTLTMAEKKLHPVSSARMILEESRNKIVKDKPSLATAGDYVDRIFTPSDRKDWQIIRYCSKVRFPKQTVAEIEI